MLRQESIAGTVCEGALHTLFVLICVSVTSSSWYS